MEDIQMATRIDDLPGPTEVQYTQEPQMNNINVTQAPMETPSMSSMPMETKKENKKGIIGLLRKEINEENILLLIILFLSTVRDYDSYLYKIFPSNVSNSGFLFNFLKALLLFLVYKLVQLYVLPKIRI